MATSTVVDHGARSPRRRRGRAMAALRFASGTVAAGLAVLALAVGGSALAAGDRPGPGVGAIAGHAVVAVAALALQIIADRRGRLVAALAALLIFALAAGSLWFWWWN